MPCINLKGKTPFNMRTKNMFTALWPPSYIFSYSRTRWAWWCRWCTTLPRIRPAWPLSKRSWTIQPCTRCSSTSTGGTAPPSPYQVQQAPTLSNFNTFKKMSKNFANGTGAGTSTVPVPFYSFTQCCGSRSAWIRNLFLDPDPELLFQIHSGSSKKWKSR